MYNRRQPSKTKLKINKGYKGETIEQKINRIVNNKEPISDTAPIVYTERKDGVQPEYNIKTDRFEIAIDAMDAVTKSYKAKREMGIGERTYDTMTNEQQAEFDKKYPTNKHNLKKINTKKDGGAEPTP